MKSGDFKQAIVEYSQAIDIDGSNCWDYVMRGRAYGSLSRFDEAIADFTKAIALNPRDADIYIYRGATYAEQGALDNAISDHSKAIELNPAYANGYYYRAAAYQKKPDLDKAIADASKAIDLNPQFDLAYYVRALCYADIGKSDLFIADLNSILRVSNNPDLVARAKSALALVSSSSTPAVKPPILIPAKESIQQKPLSLVALPTSGYVALDPLNEKAIEIEFSNTPSTQPMSKYGWYTGEILSLPKDAQLDMVVFSEDPVWVAGSRLPATDLGISFMAVLFPGKRSGAIIPTYCVQDRTDDGYRVVVSYSITSAGDYQISMFNLNAVDSRKALVNIALRPK